jgi:hypothetical protein
MLFPIGFRLLYNSKTNLAEMFSMRSYTRVVTFVQICQKTWPPCDFENSDWSIFKIYFWCFSNISAISWRPVLVVEYPDNHRP